MSKPNFKGPHRIQPNQSNNTRGVPKREVSVAAPIEDKRRSRDNNPELSSKELHDIAFRKLHIRMQKQLNRIERQFSSIIHISYVEFLSDKLSQTIARPISMFIGSFMAFSGGLILFILSSRYGFSYNDTTPLYLYAFGYVLGCILEVARIQFRKYRG